MATAHLNGQFIPLPPRAPRSAGPRVVSTSTPPSSPSSTSPNATSTARQAAAAAPTTTISSPSYTTSSGSSVVTTNSSLLRTSLQWLSTIQPWTLVITVLGTCLAIVGLPYAIQSVQDSHEALQLAKWTARKDFEEYCAALRSDGPMDPASPCAVNSTASLQPPPLVKRSAELLGEMYDDLKWYVYDWRACAGFAALGLAGLLMIPTLVRRAKSMILLVCGRRASPRVWHSGRWMFNRDTSTATRSRQPSIPMQPRDSPIAILIEEGRRHEPVSRAPDNTATHVDGSIGVAKDSCQPSMEEQDDVIQVLEEDSDPERTRRFMRQLESIDAEARLERLQRSQERSRAAIDRARRLARRNRGEGLESDAARQDHGNFRAELDREKELLDPKEEEHRKESRQNSRKSRRVVYVTQGEPDNVRVRDADAQDEVRHAVRDLEDDESYLRRYARHEFVTRDHGVSSSRQATWGDIGRRRRPERR